MGGGVKASASPSTELALDAALSASFEHAVRRASSTVLRFRIAGAPVELRCAGGGLADSLPPSFAHLREEGGPDPQLTVLVWDSRSTGAPCPPRPAVPVQASGFGPIYYYRAGAFEATYRPNAGILSAFDGSRRTAWFHVEDGSTLDEWERAAPLRQVLDWWLGSRRISFVHAGAVGSPAGGVLLGGPSGSGKSTSSLACLDSALGFAGDDYVAVEPSPEGPYVHSLYSSAKLQSGHATRLAHLRRLLEGPTAMIEDKVVLQLAPAFGDRIVTGFPLRAVLVPRVTREGPKASRITAAAALAALAPSTLLQARPTRPTALADLGSVLRQVPCFTLETGPDIEAIPPAIERLLETL